MQILIAFYSSDNACKNISLMLKKVLEEKGHNVSLIEFKPKKKLKEFEYNKLNEIDFENKSKDFDLTNYDLIFIGSSIWSYKLSKVSEQLLKSLKGIENKKFAVFCSSVIPNNALKKMESIISTNKGIVLKSKSFYSLLGFSFSRIQEVKDFALKVLEIALK